MKHISRSDIMVMLIAFVLGAICSGIISITILSKKMPEIVRIEVRKDSIPDNDKRIIRNTKAELEARESYSDTLYEDHHGNYLWGYGHMLITNQELSFAFNHNNRITWHQADSVLNADIYSRYWLIMANNRKLLHDKIYKRFIFGHE
jgi:hypothetical protein